MARSKKKAGVVPYIIEESTPKMLFLRTKSNPDAGWQIAKGSIEKNEKKRVAAFREANEELGLFEPNCKNIKDVGSFGGINLYIAEIADKNQFGDPGPDETQDTAWLTFEEFKETGRMSQKHIIKQIYNEILSTHDI